MNPMTVFVDPEGNLLTGLVTIEHNKKVLENRPIINKNMNKIKDGKENLFKMRIKQCKENKTPPLDEYDLKEALKNLKKNKARDPNEYSNELFSNEIIGDDLFKALLTLMNRMKEEQEFPEYLGLCNISSLF